MLEVLPPLLGDADADAPASTFSAPGYGDLALPYLGVPPGKAARAV